MEITIRFADKLDATAISKVYYEWSKFKNILSDDLIELGMEKESDVLKNISSDKIIYVVAIMNEEIVGVCFIDKTYLLLQNIRLGTMIVKENARSKGVGTSLLNKVKEYAIKNNVKKIWLWTQPELKSAIRLYEKNGFALEGIQKKQFCNRDALVYGFIL
jgi:GNAT superfamily N-acetyltransferase